MSPPIHRVLSIGKPRSIEANNDLAALAASGVQIIYVPEDVTDRLEVIAWIKEQVVNDGGFSAIAFWLSHIFKLLPFDETLFAPCLPPVAPKGTLRCVCGPGAGFDKIPLDYFNSEQVFYANTPEAVAEPTAAHVVILVLTALRGTTGAERSLRRGEWTSGGDSVANKTLGRSQVGLRLGIVGMGSIGRIVARYLTALGMKVSYYNRNKLSQDLEAGATYVASLDELLRNTDVLSVHVPLSTSTKGLIGARELALLPKGAVVINTSRGPLVDELALIEALKSDHISTAALDVFDVETSEGVPEYFKESNRVTITPHMACNLVDIIPHFECEMVLNLATFIQDGKPKNAVNGGWQTQI